MFLSDIYENNIKNSQREYRKHDLSIKFKAKINLSYPSIRKMYDSAISFLITIASLFLF